MKQRVITLMWGTAWERYGQKFTETFREFWPDNVELVIVTDKTLPIDWATQISLGRIPGYQFFMDECRDRPLANGIGHRRRKTSKRDGVSWKHDAVKWAPQGLCAVAGLDGMKDGDLLTWLDADVMTKASIPKGWSNVLLDGCDIACLQRADQPSEIGFWAMRVGSKTRKVIEAFNTYYADLTVFNLREWHSGFVFDAAILTVPTVTVRNLVPKGRRGNVWVHTPLNQYMWHLKGKLKDQ